MSFMTRRATSRAGINVVSTAMSSTHTCCATTSGSTGPRPPSDRSTHRNTRIVIEGTPRIVADVALGGPDRDPSMEGMIGTAARAVHSIPLVCEAPAGIRTFLDLPAVTGAGAPAAIERAQHTNDHTGQRRTTT
jgi:2,4-diaminopentanoate dehydrogenase C-terminal domain